MDFNSKILKPINKTGALKSFNGSGVKVNFSSNQAKDECNDTEPRAQGKAQAEPGKGHG